MAANACEQKTTSLGFRHFSTTMAIKPKRLGVLYVHATAERRPGQSRYQMHNLVLNQPLRLPNGQVLTPLRDAACQHLTFVEFPACHLIGRRKRPFLDRQFFLTWIPGAACEDSNGDDIRYRCQRTSLQAFYGTKKELGHIAEFFQLIESRESWEARQERFATHALETFKGFNADLTCLGFQYSVGPTFEFKDIELCKRGGHSSLLPWDVFLFYRKGAGHKYFRVLISGKREHDAHKSVAENLELLEEISEEQLAQLSGVFQTPEATILSLRGVIVGHVDHSAANQVTWY